ncbi:hypothetical protein GCM10022204_23070 [Microlunatus aurantiacus]|uniref:Uncharacterized protein n=1 Tax=Microlunatus aurantiacus TaxID=446786 RepID=A0ABP7DHY7_9ACTN
MPVALEADLEEPSLPFQASIAGTGTATPAPPVEPGDLPVVIAVRLRWHRRFRKDRTLHYREEELASGSVQLGVYYKLKPHERKTVFVEVINKKTGHKVQSNRVTFEGQPDFPSG